MDDKYKEASEAFINLLKKLDIVPSKVLECSDSVILSMEESGAEYVVFVDMIPENEVPVNI